MCFTHEKFYNKHNLRHTVTLKGGGDSTTCQVFGYRKMTWWPLFFEAPSFTIQGISCLSGDINADRGRWLENKMWGQKMTDAPTPPGGQGFTITCTVIHVSSVVPVKNLAVHFLKIKTFTLSHAIQHKENTTTSLLQGQTQAK